MREIKFRAWDKETNQWHYFIMDGCKSFDRTSMKLCDLDSEWYQFTGWKDKAGVEIYEGDIVFNGAFNFVIKLSNGVWSGYAYTTETALEVIGDIYRNPELTKSFGG